MLIFWRDLNITFSRQISCHLISLEYENYKQTLSLGDGFKHFSFSPRKLGIHDPQFDDLRIFFKWVEFNSTTKTRFTRSLQNHGVFLSYQNPPKSFFRGARTTYGTALSWPTSATWEPHGVEDDGLLKVFFFFEFWPCKKIVFGYQENHDC